MQIAPQSATLARHNAHRPSIKQGKLVCDVNTCNPEPRSTFLTAEMLRQVNDNRDCRSLYTALRVQLHRQSAQTFVKATVFNRSHAYRQTKFANYSKIVATIIIGR